MNESGKRALVEISNNRDTRKYEQHLAKSSGFLRESVGAINDRLHFRRTHVEQLAAKRTERGKEKSEFEAAAEDYAEKLGKEVSALTSQSESALREVIDYRAELEDEKAVLEQVHDQVHAQEPRHPRPERKRKVRRPDPPGDDDDDDEADDDGVDTKGEGEDVEMEEPEDEIPYIGASEMLESIRRAKASEYEYLSMHERYGLNNDYISFKRTLHDAQYQDGAPLPDASTWFGPDGRPVVGILRDRNNGDQKESQEEDEDLVIEREVLSFKCPLTQQTMKEPYSSKVCKHSFEKEAILTFIRENHGQCRCPECPAVSHHHQYRAAKVMGISNILFFFFFFT